MKNLPLWLSLSRIIFLPLLYWLLFSGSTWWFFATYIIIASTDFFDGIVARKLGVASKRGQQADSFADIFFYISSAYFLYYLFPEIITANNLYLVIFFSTLGLSYLVSLVLFRRLVLLHTTLLRLNAVLVFFVVITSFFMDTTLFVRFILILFTIAHIEEIIIFFMFGAVDPDTKGLYSLITNSNKSITG